MWAVLTSLLAFVGWGINDALAIKLFRLNDPAKITVATGVLRSLGWIILMPLFIHEFSKITFVPLVYNLIAGFSSGLGYYLFGKAAQKTNPVLVSSLGGAWGVSTVLLSLVFFGEKINFYKSISIFLVFLGVFLVNFKIQTLTKLKHTKDIGIYYALATLVVWGVCGAFLKFPAMAYGWYWTSLIMLVPYLILILFFERRIAFNFKALKINNFKLFLVIVLCTMLGDLGYNSSFTLGGSIAMVGTIGGSYAVLSTVMAYFMYKEPLTKQQLWGVLSTLLGIVSMAIFSSI